MVPKLVSNSSKLQCYSLEKILKPVNHPSQDKHLVNVYSMFTDYDHFDSYFENFTSNI